MKNEQKYIKLIVLIFISFSTNARAQEVENKFQGRSSVELSYKLIDGVKISLTPELRFDDGFSIDKYIVEGEIKYQPVKFVDFSASYRFIADPGGRTTDYYNRYAFSASLKDKFSRFEPSFRLKYSNYADDDVYDKNFLRYKLELKYDIKNCKLNPEIGAEAYQLLDNSGIYKMRYSVGVDYKLFKGSYLGLNYKFDYYYQEYKNRHVIGLGYKIKF